MSAAHIDDVLALTGRLDDSTIEDPARERFRAYLVENVTDAALLRDYIDQCRSRPDEQHGRALRDLINHYGRLLGFDVSYGPYEWLPGQVGFDGRWTSPWGLHIVVEVKSRETFAAQRPSLARSVEKLIADGIIPNWTLALGLYVVVHPDLQVNHLEKAILDEKQTHQIRTITPESLYTLTVLQRSGQLSQQDVLTLLRSSSPAADWLVELVSRLSNGMARVTQSGAAASATQAALSTPTAQPDAGVSANDWIPMISGTGRARQPDSEFTASEPSEPAAAQPEPEPEPEPSSGERASEASEGQPAPEPAHAESETSAAEPEPEPSAAQGGAQAAVEPAPLDLAEVLECFGNCVVRTLEYLLHKRLQ